MELDLIQIAMSLSILAFSVIVHEIAHGYVAYRLGDPTAYMMKRLTFNPINHIDPVGSILMPLIMVLSHSPVFLAWAKPVPINPGYFRHPRRDDILVSIAGVTVNMLLAIAAAIALRLLPLSMNEGLATFLYLLCSINVGLAVFNMVPIPPLDGSHVVASLLSPQAARAYGQISEYGFIIIIVLSGTGVLNRMIGPVMHGVMKLLLVIGTS